MINLFRTLICNEALYPIQTIGSMPNLGASGHCVGRNLIKPIIDSLPSQKHHRENYVVNHEGKLP